MLRLLRFQHTEDGAKDDGVGCVTPHFRQTRPTVALRTSSKTRTHHTSPVNYLKLGMQLGRMLEMPSSGTVFAADYDHLSSPKHHILRRGSISLVSRMIELHGYHMTSYTKTCETPWARHLARTKADSLVMVSPGCSS